MTDLIKKQRNYDALLIKAFRDDIYLNKLYFWLKPYGINLPDPDLKRQPPPAKMTVRVFVGAFLKPLADRLWDTERNQDIKTLDWMVNLNCEKYANRKIANDRQKMKRENNIFNGKSQLIKRSLAMDKLSNQWQVTKPNSKLRRIK